MNGKSGESSIRRSNLRCKSGQREPISLTADEEARLKSLEEEFPDQAKEFRDALTDARTWTLPGPTRTVPRID